MPFTRKRSPGIFLNSDQPVKLHRHQHEKNRRALSFRTLVLIAPLKSLRS